VALRQEERTTMFVTNCSTNCFLCYIIVVSVLLTVVSQGQGNVQHIQYQLPASRFRSTGYNYQELKYTVTRQERDLANRFEYSQDRECGRVPENDGHARKTPGDSGFRIRVIGQPAPEQYTAGQVYTGIIYLS